MSSWENYSEPPGKDAPRRCECYPPREALAELGDHLDALVMNSDYVREIRLMGGRGPHYIAVDQT
jgi:hypothetical protein